MPSTPTSVVMYVVSQARRGVKVATATRRQSGLARNAARTYASSTAVSHLRYWAKRA